MFVDKVKCVGCEECLHVCPLESIIMKHEKAEILQCKCDECERCIPVCPVKAIGFASTSLNKRCI
ncbi:MAG: 4Fe-4S binding protein [Candidatus Brocadia sp.]